jgi:hypothetical protein
LGDVTPGPKQHRAHAEHPRRRHVVVDAVADHDAVLRPHQQIVAAAEEEPYVGLLESVRARHFAVPEELAHAVCIEHRDRRRWLVRRQSESQSFPVQPADDVGDAITQFERVSRVGAGKHGSVRALRRCPVAARQAPDDRRVRIGGEVLDRPRAGFGIPRIVDRHALRPERRHDVSVDQPFVFHLRIDRAAHVEEHGAYRHSWHLLLARPRQRKDTARIAT